MELKQIKELMAAMGRTGTKKLQLKKENFELLLERGDDEAFRGGEYLPENFEVQSYRQEPAQRANAALARGTENSQNLAAHAYPPPVADKEEASSLYITSPMVGTFYVSPTPGDPSFVKVGDKIDKHTVVCIIEAMKVMNEVKSGVAGTVVEQLVEDGHPVEFGTKLFRIV